MKLALLCKVTLGYILILNKMGAWWALMVGGNAESRHCGTSAEVFCAPRSRAGSFRSIIPRQARTGVIHLHFDSPESLDKALGALSDL